MLTAHLVTRLPPNFDPIFEVAMSAVGNFAGWVWQAKASPARLLRGRVAMMGRFWRREEGDVDALPRTHGR